MQLGVALHSRGGEVCQVFICHRPPFFNNFLKPLQPLTGALSDRLKDDQFKKFPNELKSMSKTLDEIQQRGV